MLTMVCHAPSPPQVHSVVNQSTWQQTLTCLNPVNPALVRGESSAHSLVHWEFIQVQKAAPLRS